MLCKPLLATLQLPVKGLLGHQEIRKVGVLTRFEPGDGLNRLWEFDPLCLRSMKVIQSFGDWLKKQFIFLIISFWILISIFGALAGLVIHNRKHINQNNAGICQLAIDANDKLAFQKAHCPPA